MLQWTQRRIGSDRVLLYRGPNRFVTTTVRSVTFMTLCTFPAATFLRQYESYATERNLGPDGITRTWNQVQHEFRRVVEWVIRVPSEKEAVDGPEMKQISAQLTSASPSFLRQLSSPQSLAAVYAQTAVVFLTSVALYAVGLRVTRSQVAEIYWRRTAENRHLRETLLSHFNKDAPTRGQFFSV
jgi:hypothetical protein